MFIQGGWYLYRQRAYIRCTSDYGFGLPSLVSFLDHLLGVAIPAVPIAVRGQTFGM